MPLECPVFTKDYNHAYSSYNACLDCGYKHDKECWYYIKSPQKLSEVLTLDERLAILENKEEIQIFKPRPVDNEIDQLKARLIYLQNKLNEHLDRKRKSRYD